MHKRVIVKKLSPPKCKCGAVADHYMYYMDPTSARMHSDDRGKVHMEPKLMAYCCEACLLRTFCDMLNQLGLVKQTEEETPDAGL